LQQIGWCWLRAYTYPGFLTRPFCKWRSAALLGSNWFFCKKLLRSVCVFFNALFVSIHKRTSVSRSIEALAVPHMYMIPSCWSYQEKELSRRILLVFSLVPC
jgi:hypothetical protein